MSGETEQQVSGWTTDTLHSHLLRVLQEMDRRNEQRFQEQEKATDKALNAAEKATDAALAAAKEAAALLAVDTEKWQAASNEWRGAMTDRESKFMTRSEYAESRKATLALLVASVTFASLILAVITLITQ